MNHCNENQTLSSHFLFLPNQKFQIINLLENFDNLVEFLKSQCVKLPNASSKTAIAQKECKTQIPVQ